jgi:hypothetical protein
MALGLRTQPNRHNVQPLNLVLLIEQKGDASLLLPFVEGQYQKPK